MEVTLIYLSQTGNTKKVAFALAEAFQGAGHSSRVINLKQGSFRDAVKGDLLGVGTPCISSKAPTPIKLFLHSLPPIPGKNAFVFATSGGAPGRVLLEISNILVSKGANVLGGFLTRGQVNHPAPHMIGRFPDHPNTVDINRAHQFALEISEYVRHGHSKPLMKEWNDGINSNWGFYSTLGLISSDWVVRLLLPEPSLDHICCDQCELCAEECPMENLTLNPFPVIGNQCIRCYRCFSVCPHEAFKLNWKFADPFLWFLYNTIFLRWFGDLVPGERIY